ncbi:MAG TPA: patatin-like phospholipase family protein [Acidimicrobiales bacterium]|nr:patatin-like phospholipase family protein [Acidimicrobiales bacterium]
MTSRRVGIVYGAGGTVGMAYHAGVTRALEQVAGIRPADADLLVGTSAGSVIAAYLRSGWTGEDFWAFALGTHPSLAELSDDDAARRRRDILTPRWRSPFELSRIAVGSAYVLGQAVVRRPALPVPGVLRRRFPGGLFAMTEGERRLPEELAQTWPDKALYLCAVDINTGRRIVLGREGAPEVTVAQAVLASCAIPGFYPPVKVGKYTLVDGGVHSSTNLDLAAKFGCDLIIGIAPMAYEPIDAPGPIRQLVRLIPTRALSRETAQARRRGAEVLLIRPTAAELAIHGANLMRPDAGEEIARASYEAAARLLETDRFKETLAA